MEYVIEAQNLSFSYKSDDGEGNVTLRKAVNDISLEIKKGEYVAMLGPNGSGKSTLAKLFDILELPDDGHILVFGNNTKDEDAFWDIRENVSYVFQNPDNQIVGTIVEEDVAFGPENLGVPLPELRQRVDDALKSVGLENMATRQAASLSGGQKQKLAIAGALAMKPSVLILDEATAMLDPEARDEFLNLAEGMREKFGLTLITITHDMSEAMRCDRVFVIQSGRLVAKGTPAQIFSQKNTVIANGLELPVHIKLTDEIAKICGSSLQTEDLESITSCIEAAKRIIRNSKVSHIDVPEQEKKGESETILSVKNLSYYYESKQKEVLHNMNLDINKGEILAIIGKSGCGKTTLISHFNAIFRPQNGDVELYLEDGKVLRTSNKKQVMEIRQNIGLVFQYPEYQLFEETVYKDIAYGLRKMKLDENEQRKRIHEACELVGFPTELLNESPFELSGGQKRRVALAGVLVMRPKVLVLDEPASGLDPRGRQEMFRIIKKLKKNGTTIVIVSHNMDEVAAFADRICCIKDGEIKAVKNTTDFFMDEQSTREMGMALPKLYDFSKALKQSLKEDYPGITFGNCKRNAELEAVAIVNAVRGESNA